MGFVQWPTCEQVQVAIQWVARVECCRHSPSVLAAARLNICFPPASAAGEAPFSALGMPLSATELSRVLLWVVLSAASAK